jgi:hypothetical protein
MEFKMCIIGDVLYGDTSAIEIDPKSGAAPPKKKLPGGLSFYDERLLSISEGLEDNKDVNLVLND